MSNEGRARSAALPEGAMLMGGKYRIVRKLGQGGFGITYLAEHVVLRKRVAIKEFFFQQFCERDDGTSHVTVPTVGNRELVEKFRRKFVKEAQLIASKLSHPSIVGVTDVFDENGTSYYVMDYIEGRSLSDIIKERGRIGEAEAIAIIDSVCRALAYVHSRNINHLDIKPGNIMVEAETGNVVLIDFGVAKQYDAATGEATTTTPVGRSHGYSPLEQYKVGGVSQFSPESDIYALGATLYKMLTGTTPPEAGDVAQDGLPPIPSDISASVRRAITAAMSTAKKDRPHTVAEFLGILHGKTAGGEETEVEEKKPKQKQDDIEEIVIDDGKGNSDNNGNNEGRASGSGASGHIPHPEPQPEPTPQPRRKWLPWTVAVGVAAVVFVAIMLLRPKPEPIPPDIIAAVTSGVDTVSQPQQPVQPPSQPQVQQQQPAQPTVQQPTQQQLQPVQQPAQPQQQVQPTPQSNLPEIEMVWVSGGTFTIGATSEQGSDADSDEKPAHSVTLSGYYIGKYEVTQKLWKAVMGSNPSYFKGDDLPVECVSWNDVQEFLRKLNRMTGKNYRLPTEAEWEYAARGGSNSSGNKYSGSNNIGSVAWYYDNSGSTTHPVGSKSPNELGIYDMSGNVLEWCQDRWASNYYSSSPQRNPQGPASGSYRVLRGGSWFGSAGHCRVSRRNSISPDYWRHNLGFRLVL
ncbi:MAG TPA: SUMF1/EgtB/PvdO family nonheme iron enzyme [Candidatus Avimuribaculum pullicola]|nr:SUMF1/EgtB/PvdO family nonheme iron enzyme [Candidatus Avimuribaculum pullicola]